LRRRKVQVMTAPNVERGELAFTVQGGPDRGIQFLADHLLVVGGT